MYCLIRHSCLSNEMETVLKIGIMSYSLLWSLLWLRAQGYMPYVNQRVDSRSSINRQFLFETGASVTGDTNRSQVTVGCNNRFRKFLG